MIIDLIKILLFTIWIYIGGILLVMLKMKAVNLDIIYDAFYSTYEMFPVLYLLTACLYFYNKVNKKDD